MINETVIQYQHAKSWKGGFTDPSLSFLAFFFSSYSLPLILLTFPKKLGNLLEIQSTNGVHSLKAADLEEEYCFQF